MNRMNFWVLLSILIHLLIAIFFSFKISFGNKSYVNISYLNITDFKEKPLTKEEKKIVIKKEGDITPTEQKIIETNINETEEESETVDPNKFVPFYMVEELPTPLSKISPQYPEEAKRLGIEGAVVLKLYISENGCIEDIEIVKSPHELLSIASKKAIAGIKFKPAKVSGKTVPVCLELTLRFKLNG